MRFSIFKVLVVLIIVLLCIGFYRGWIVLSNNKDALNNKVDIKLTVDPDKVKEDTDKLKQKSSEFTNKNQKQPLPGNPNGE
jgi:hypothetical protein